jgi:2-polyprenyl-3-methyl-5-hydroxy-6-metoxy-1,4-benzoquinol methylase
LSWSFLTEWWLAEIANDPAYAEVVAPLLIEVLRPRHGDTYLDLGCGEGRVMRAISSHGATVHGLDVNPDLARRAQHSVVADLTAIPMRSDAYDGVYSVLTLEHVPDHERFFTEAARVTKPGGVLALVTNHPVWTAPESTPISDADGEILWRPGEYFTKGLSEIPAGDSTVVFHHRSMSDLLNAASDAGWILEHMIEQPHHEYDDQAGIPRLLACRWRLRPET